MKAATNFLVLLILLLTACQERDKSGRNVNTPTTGSITIVADESLRPLVEAEVAAFNGIYHRANVKAIYLPEADAINALLKEDTLRIAIVTRKLTEEESKYMLTERKLRSSALEVATSGIALIVNPANKDTLISIDQIKGILSGKIKTWAEMGGRSKNGIEIVFDNPNSGLIRQLKDSVAKVDKLPANCFAVNDNEAVVDYVEKNVNAVGLIGVEWISDADDSTMNTFRSRIKVVGVSGDSIHFQPYQAYLALKHYPLMRNITIINCEGRTGLGTGFAAFVASERGQRVILKAGLAPKTMPLRIVQVNPKPFKIEQ
jgi:phosphate transport system substrate-binding protein